MKIYSCLKVKKKIRARAENPSLFTHSWGLVFSLCFDSLLKSSSTFKYTESIFSQDNSGHEEKERKKSTFRYYLQVTCKIYTESLAR